MHPGNLATQEVIVRQQSYRGLLLDCQGGVSFTFELSGPPPTSSYDDSCVYCVDRRASLARESCEPVVVLFTLSPHQLSVLPGSEKTPRKHFATIFGKYCPPLHAFTIVL